MESLNQTCPLNNTCEMYNCTENNTTGCPYDPPPTAPWTIVSLTFYVIIFVIGLIGNILVIIAVLRHPKMKTVTNIYILNLAVADSLFLIGLPFLIATTIQQRWVFGFFMCKVFFFLTSINWFGSVFTLTVMSADRYMAVCHPIRSIRYRTRFVALLVCCCVWLVSLLVMLPIILYSTTIAHPRGGERCTISWPDGQPISADMAFIWYSMLVGFGIPLPLICVFYTLLVLRLRTVGPKKKSKEKKRSQRHVTVMVLSVVTVYVISWLPYWVFQVYITFAPPDRQPPFLQELFSTITIFSYANSALNPVLYAFLSENFRKSFVSSFKCMSADVVNGDLQVEQSTMPNKRITGNNTQCTAVTALTTTAVTSVASAKPSVHISSRENCFVNREEKHLEIDDEDIHNEDTHFIINSHTEIDNNHCDKPADV